MYNHFFGFHERPFKLVPNPDYLFLSKSHEEALAHLRYAVTDGEGFVEIIGEIGTGKTMLCRAFLESLGPDTESAYIFNPRMDAIDLLKAITDEFGIPSSGDSIKSLIDALNAFLIEKKASGKKVILLIDEAQNLSKDVLEQIRLLSNLETTKDKLLQIILVGQPELGEMLDSYELRQLGQRISLSCRLHPLTYAETKRYIAHRLQVASRKTGSIFSTGAVRRIYQFSRGVPRLINMACDRALLTAFGRHQLKVSGRTAQSAIRELASRGEIRRSLLAGNTPGLVVVSALCIVIALGLFLHFDLRRLITGSPSADMPASVGVSDTVPPHSPVVSPSNPPMSLPEEKNPEDRSNPPGNESSENSRVSEPTPDTLLPTIADAPVDFKQLLMDHRAVFSRQTSFERVLNSWAIAPNFSPEVGEISDDPAFFVLAAQQAGLVATPVISNLAQIVRLNVPVILAFNPPSGAGPVYLTAIQATPDAMIFSGTDALPEIVVPYARVLELWNGSAVVFWKNFYSYQGTIPLDAPGESVITLKLHLREIGYRHIDISGTFDLATQMAIKAVQARHGIPIDGYVGPLTKIVLYNEKLSLPIPHLWEQMTFPDAVTKMEIPPNTSGRVLPEPETVYNKRSL